MKKIIITMLFFFPILIFSQESSLGINGGYTTNGYAGQLGYYHSLNSNSDLHLTLYVSFAEDKKENVTVPYNDINLNLGYFYKVVQDRYNRFNLSLGGGGLIGYEIINNGNKELKNGSLITVENKFVYGVYGGIDISYYLSDAFALTAVANQFYHINSDIGNTFFYGGIGIKYTLFK